MQSMQKWRNQQGFYQKLDNKLITTHKKYIANKIFKSFIIIINIDIIIIIKLYVNANKLKQFADRPSFCMYFLVIGI